MILTSDAVSKFLIVNSEKQLVRYSTNGQQYFAVVGGGLLEDYQWPADLESITQISKNFYFSSLTDGEQIIAFKEDNDPILPAQENLLVQYADLIGQSVTLDSPPGSVQLQEVPNDPTLIRIRFIYQGFVKYYDRPITREDGTLVTVIRTQNQEQQEWILLGHSHDGFNYILAIQWPIPMTETFPATRYRANDWSETALNQFDFSSNDVLNLDLILTTEPISCGNIEGVSCEDHSECCSARCGFFKIPNPDSNTQLCCEFIYERRCA